MQAREYALNTLERIIVHHGYASLILRARKESFSDVDTALISELVYGTLRNKYLLEYQWKDLVKRTPSPRTALLLDMSVYQLFFLEKIPDYAILNDANDLAKGDGKFVNAILRSVQKRGRITPTNLGPLETLSVTTSHPMWLLKLWNAHYGQEITERIASADQESAIVYGRMNPLKISKEKLYANEKFHPLEGDAFTYDGILRKTKEFQQGMVLIQDRSSQKIPEYLDAQPGMEVLDCCAAPGTKTQQIAAMMQNRGHIVAGDLHENRTQLIQQLMDRTGVQIVSPIVRDACAPKEAPESFDRILIDAPCSGLGDLSHKPEIRYHTHPEDLDSLVETQRKILLASAPLLKKGGKMVYSTCTLNKKENENQVAKFLANHPDYECIQEKTYFPYESNSDGFYVAQIVRKSSNMVE